MKWVSGFGYRARRGFTLLEVMIALVLLSLLLAVLFAGLRLGAQSWDAGQTRVGQAADRAQVLAFLDRQLARAEPVFWHDPRGSTHLAFEGRRDAVAWVAALPAHRGGGGLALLSLELGRIEGQSSLVLGHQLFHPDTLDPGVFEEHEVLLEGVTEIAIEYFGPGEGDVGSSWSDVWSDRSELPRLIRVRIVDERSPWPDLVVAPRQGSGAQAWVTELR